MASAAPAHGSRCNFAQSSDMRTARTETTSGSHSFISAKHTRRRECRVAAPRVWSYLFTIGRTQQLVASSSPEAIQ